jgi:two-component system cell cycle sensor histidine kinase/response regulator CckA
VRALSALTSATTDPARTRRAHGLSLHAYFALLIVMFLLVAGAGTTYIHFQARAHERADALRAARYAATTAANQLGSEIATLRATVQGLATTPHIERTFKNATGCSLAFSAGAGTKDDRGHIDIIRKDGTPVCSSRKIGGRSSQRVYGHAAWWPEATRPSFAAPVPDRATGHQVALSSASIPGGAVAGFLDLTALAPQLVSQYGGGRPVEFLITSRDGRTVIGRSIDAKRWIGAPISGATSGTERRDLDGTSRFYAQATVPGTGWRLYAGEDKKAALAGAFLLEKEQLMITLAGLFAFLLAALFVYRRVARPVAVLGAAVRSATGSRSRSFVVAPDHSPLEVSALAANVNDLITSLRRSEEGYRLLFEQHPSAMWVFDPETLRVSAVNERAIDAYGYSRDEFIGKKVDEFRPEEDRAAAREMITQLTGRQYEAKSRHLTKDGAVIDVEVRSSEIEFGGRSSRLVLANDVTERRRLEEQLRQSQKMEAVGSLAGGIAHDINNIVMVIRTSCTLLFERMGITVHREVVEQIDTAAERAAGLTRQLLAFSRQQVLHPEVTDPNLVIEQIVDLLHRVIGEDIEVLVERDPELACVVVDRSQLGQVILNLAVNARDAMPNGGKLTVQTRNVALDEPYGSEHVGVAPGDYVLIQMTDTGVGMDDETQRRVFDPFFTTKDTGSGLGLATVYGIVNQSGGHIWLYSEPGVGTTFKLYFPSTTHSPAAPAPRPEADSLQGTETVLLVEDEVVLRPLIGEVLRSYGYTVIEAGDGHEALQVALEHGDSIQVLVTDIVMPGMSGRELADRLLAERPSLRVLFTSGYPLGTFAPEGGEHPNSDYIDKPFGLEELARKLRELLAREL